MGQRFDPQTWLKRVFPKGIEKSGLLNDKLEIKKTYLKALVRATSVSQRQLTREIYKTVDFYLEKEERLKAQGVKAFKQEALNGQALLTERIKNFLVYSEVQAQKKAHKGRKYRWLPSSAKEPDPEHQLLYGQVLEEGKGDKEGYMPGERWGCQCGIEWLDEAEDLILLNTPSKTIERTRRMFNMAVAGKGLEDRSTDFVFGKITGKQWHRIKRQTGLDLKGFSEQLRVEGIRHAYLHHGSATLEAARHQKAVTAKDVALIPHITQFFDRVVLEKKKAGERLLFLKKINKKTYSYVANISRKKKLLINKTFFIKQ